MIPAQLNTVDDSMRPSNQRSPAARTVGVLETTPATTLAAMIAKPERIAAG